MYDPSFDAESYEHTLWNNSRSPTQLESLFHRQAKLSLIEYFQSGNFTPAIYTKDFEPENFFP